MLVVAPLSVVFSQASYMCSAYKRTVALERESVTFHLEFLFSHYTFIISGDSLLHFSLTILISDLRFVGAPVAVFFFRLTLLFYLFCFDCTMLLYLNLSRGSS